MRHLFLLALALAIPLNAFAIGAEWPISESPRYWSPAEGLFRLSLDTAYFHTTKNYNSLGSSYQPVYLDKVDYLSTRLNGGFGLTSRLSVFGQLEARDLNMKANRFAAEAPADAKKLSPGDAFLGFRWLVFSSRQTDTANPTDWVPASFLALVEGTWNTPLYGHAASGKPPAGDNASDLSTLARAVWFTNDWLALSASIGYIYRTAHYAGLLPWSLRADFLLGKESFRFWTDLQSTESLKTPNYSINPYETDPFPNGSLLFKSYSPTIRTLALGTAYPLAREWELAAAFFLTAGGVNSAKGMGGSLGLSWHPY